jgi:hypothetical protein
MSIGVITRNKEEKITHSKYSVTPCTASANSHESLNRYLVGNLNEKDHLKNQGAQENIILIKIDLK